MIVKGTEILTPRNIGLGVALLVIAISAAMGWRTPLLQIGNFGAEAIIAGIAGIILLVVTMRYTEFGPFALVLAAFSIRLSIPVGAFARIPASLVLTVVLIGIWIVGMFLRRSVKLFPSAVNLPLIGFIVVASFSYPYSWLAWRPDFWDWEDPEKFRIVQLGGLAVMVLLPLVALFTLNAARETKIIKWVFVTIVVIAIPELIQRVAQKYFFQFGGLGISGPGLYHLWLLSLLYAQVLFNKQLSKRVRVFFIIVILAWFLYLFVLRLEWFSGWLTAIVAILFLSFIRSRKVTLVLIAAMLVPFLLGADYYYQNIWVKAQTNDFNRLDFLWPTIIFDLTLSKAGILFGSGPAGYATYFMTYYLGQAMSAHNNYVDIIAETGIVGTFFFLWMLWVIFRTGWSQHKLLKDGFLSAFNIGVLGGFVGMLFAMMLDDWFIPFAYNNGLPGFDMNVYAWVLVGLMLGLKRFIPSHSTETNFATNKP